MKAKAINDGAIKNILFVSDYMKYKGDSIYTLEVTDICEITKNLTTHFARHTFATTVTLANGISMESTSKMLGHSGLVMTKKYARILDSTIGQEMNQLAEKLQFHLN
jgi:site-specific recombinase XerD